jgi:hypothetical protein
MTCRKTESTPRRKRDRLKGHWGLSCYFDRRTFTSVLTELGVREPGIKHLTDAIAAFCAALLEFAQASHSSGR